MYWSILHSQCMFLNAPDYGWNWNLRGVRFVIKPVGVNLPSSHFHSLPYTHASSCTTFMLLPVMCYFHLMLTDSTVPALLWCAAASFCATLMNCCQFCTPANSCTTSLYSTTARSCATSMYCCQFLYYFHVLLPVMCYSHVLLPVLVLLPQTIDSC